MRSLRTRITVLTVLVAAVAVVVTTLLSVVFIRSHEQRENKQLLLLLCETGERNLDYYFNGVQKSVAKVAAFAERDLDGLETGQLESHMKRVSAYFAEMANKTSGVLTYYYRIDPEVSKTVKGFWYTNLDGTDFTEHAVTDITLYDTQDTSKLVWFTVPKHQGEAIWLPPYITDNLDVRVISYNMPIYYRGRFVGVVGIEIDYSTMAEQVESIRLHSNGYAFLSDEEGKLFFHPRIDVAQMSDGSMRAIPEGFHSESTFLNYKVDGVEKIAAWLPLSNGMRLIVSVPISETEGDWHQLIGEILIASGLVLIAMGTFTMLYTRRITRPLEKLTEAANQVGMGNYDFSLEYEADDEIGKLTSTFRQLANHMKQHITDLNKRVYVDALTSVRNKGAFSAALDTLQSRIDAQELHAFAVGVFDCNNLKLINDRYGHDKGDAYLKNACQLICRVFKNSPVFRIGGDEFAVILQDQEYEQREELVQEFERAAETICGAAMNQWEEVRVAMGLAEYDPKNDGYVIDTVRRADKNMYANKRARKNNVR